jgi:zinc protease
MLNNRLTEKGFEPETSFSYAYMGGMSLTKMSHFAVIAASAKEGRAKETLREILIEKERALKYGFTKAEIDRAKIELISRIEQTANEKDKIESSSLESELLAFYLEGAAFPGIDWEANAIKALVPKISSTELSKKLKAIFAENDVTVFISANENESATLPSDAEIAAIFKDVGAAKIERPSNKKAKGELLESRPAPGLIVNETADDDNGVISFELENGAKVVLKPTDNQNDEILLFGAAKGGFTAVNEARLSSARLAADFLKVSGIGK